MKIMNKLNIAILGISGVISNPVFAQKFYQCLPIKCSDGQYLDGSNCKSCPKGFECKNNQKTACRSGFYANKEGMANCKSCNGFSSNANAQYCFGKKEFTPGTYTLTIPAGKWKATIRGGYPWYVNMLGNYEHKVSSGFGATLVKYFTLEQEEQIKIIVGKKTCGGGGKYSSNGEDSSIELLTKSGGGVSGITRVNKLIAGGGKVNPKEEDLSKLNGQCEYSGLSLNSSIGEKCYHEVSNSNEVYDEIRERKLGYSTRLGDGGCGVFDGKVVLELIN